MFTLIYMGYLLTGEPMPAHPFLPNIYLFLPYVYLIFTPLFTLLTRILTLAWYAAIRKVEKMNTKKNLNSKWRAPPIKVENAMVLLKRGVVG